MIAFLLDLYELKEEARRGWLLRGVHEPESVADHSWGTAMLCMVYADRADVQREHAVVMALVHDLAESVTGDHATRVATMRDPAVAEQKRIRELRAMDRLLAEISGDIRAVGDHIRELWDEYEAAVSPVATFVRDMNLIDMCLQAYRYEREPGRYDESATAAEFAGFPRLEEFFATTEPRLSTDLGRELFAELYARYRGLVAGGGASDG